MFTCCVWNGFWRWKCLFQHTKTTKFVRPRFRSFIRPHQWQKAAKNRSLQCAYLLFTVFCHWWGLINDRSRGLTKLVVSVILLTYCSRFDEWDTQGTIGYTRILNLKKKLKPWNIGFKGCLISLTKCCVLHLFNLILFCTFSIRG